MPKRKEIDNKQLIQAVQDGLNTKEIKEAFNFKASSQVKLAYLHAVMDEGIVPEIKDGRTAAAKPEQKEATINKRGSLIIPKELVREMGFKEGDSFTTRKTKAGISLKQTNIETPSENEKRVVKHRKKRAARSNKRYTHATAQSF